MQTRYADISGTGRSRKEAEEAEITEATSRITQDKTGGVRRATLRLEATFDNQIFDVVLIKLIDAFKAKPQKQVEPTYKK